MEEAAPVVEGFLSAFSALDAPAMKTYAHESKVFEQEAFLNFEKICNGGLMDMMGEDAAIFAGNEEQLERLVTAMIEKLSSTISYKISEGKQLADGSVEFDVEVTVFDPESVNVHFGQHLANSMSQEKLMEIVTELMNNGTITESTTEEEMMSILMPVIMDIAIEAIQTMELSTTTISGTLVVTRKDGAVLLDLDREKTPGLFV